VPTVFLSFSPDRLLEWYTAEAVSRLEELAVVKLNPGPAELSPEELVEIAADCEVIVADRLTPGYGEVFSRLDDLVAFVRCAMDVRNIDLQAASRSGVLVTHASPSWVDPVSELVLGLMLNLARGVADTVAAYRRGVVPTPGMGIQLSGRTLGIIAYGHLGRRLAELGRALHMRVLVFDPNVEQLPDGIERVDLDGLLVSSDFVVCLAPHTPKTENLVGAREFGLMKESAFFVNASRGKLVDEAALEEALITGSIAGAGLDVGREPDDLPSRRIARLGNVVAAPHIGGFVPEAIAGQALQTVEQVAEILDGRIPKGALNGESAGRLGRFGKPNGER
jgi:D-3-phosphoglycerate dehydrogenase